MQRFVLAVLAATPLAAAAQAGTGAVDTPAAAGTPATTKAEPASPHRAVFLGAGLGTALISSERGQSASTIRLRIGLPRSERLLLGIEAGLSNGGAAQVRFYDAAATFFPWERFFFVRAGVGITDLTDVSEPFGPSQQGPNVLAGVGLAFGSRRGLNLSLNVEGQLHATTPAGAAYATYDGRRSTLSAWLGLDWY